MNITQKFYNSLASHYDKLFADWEAAVGEQAQILQRIFRHFGMADTASILDCACGCREVIWMSAEETGFYQPIVVVKR